MGSLGIHLLGIPEIYLNELRLSFRSRKALAVLIYLTVEQGMHSRDSLMTMFWPKSSQINAAATLRTTLSRLRKTLGPLNGILVSDGSKVGFDLNYEIDLDLDMLRCAANEDSLPDELNSILIVDRGEFLEGFSLLDAPAFDDWVSIQRGVCLRQLEKVYNRLSLHLLSKYESALAIEISTQWVKRAPLNEQAYRRLMAAQVMHGQRPSALLTYHQLKDTLKKELGLQPSRETILLANSIDHGSIGTEHINVSLKIGQIFSTDQQGHLILPLVGRSAEHSRLVDSFHHLENEKAQVVVLIGAAGVGKTQLINAFKEWVLLDSPETEIWQGKAYETGGRLAFQPVVDALRIRLDQVNAPEDLLEDVWLAELSQLMPELRARYPDLPLPLSGDANFIRARLFETVTTLGKALTGLQRSIFILEDMQWADADTLDLVHYLARRWSEMNTPILLLMTVRQEAYAANSSLREWLVRLERDSFFTRLLIDNLGGADVEDLISRLAEKGADETTISNFATWLWAETRGLPFFIEALLQMLIEQGVLVPVEGKRSTFNFVAALEHVHSVARVPLPPGVREVIRARLEQHSKEANALLLASAVLGRSCTFERMCQIANLHESDGLGPLESLLDGRLLAERPKERQPYTLAHDYIREVVYTESNEARRRVYHRRALLALETAGGSSAECAYHALAALLDEPAFRYSVAAGSEVFSSYALQDALKHFDTAHEVSRNMQKRGEVVDIGLLGSLYKQRGQALEICQDDQAAVVNYEEMRAEAVKHESKSMELSALVILSNIHGHYTGVFNPLKSKELALKALVLARELGDKVAEAHALWGLQIAELYSAGDTKQVIAYGQQALELARELGLKELTGLVLNNLAWPFGAQKKLEQCRKEFREAQRIWQELGNLQKLAEASRFMLIIHSMAGDHRSILKDAPKLSKLGASIGSRLDEKEGLAWLAPSFMRQGRFALAMDCLDQYRDYSDSLGHPNERHGHQLWRTSFYLTVGSLEEAERWADELYAEQETIPPNFATSYFIEVARTKIARGKMHEGQEILDDLVKNLPNDTAWSYTIIDIAIGYGELNLAMNQLENIFNGLEKRVHPYREAGFNRLLADEHWLRGKAALALRNYDLARATLLKAKEAAEAQEERSILWKILATMSEVEYSCGNLGTADELRNQALDVINDIAEHAGDMRDLFLNQPELIKLRVET